MQGGMTPKAAAEKAFKRVEEIFSKYPIEQSYSKIAGPFSAAARPQNAFLPIITDRRVPDISPLYADLKNVCPASFTVGTKDALLDDTLFMHARWVAARHQAEFGNLPLYPGGAHGFTLSPNDVSKSATVRMDAFLNGVLG